MARYGYRKIIRRPGSPAVTTVVEAPSPSDAVSSGPDYAAMTKPLLIAAAEAAGLDSSGTKSELVARLEQGGKA